MRRAPAISGCVSNQLAGLVGKVEENGAALEQRQRPAVRPIGVDDRRDLAVGIERQELGRFLIVGFEADPMGFIGQPDFLQHDRYLDPVRRVD